MKFFLIALCATVAFAAPEVTWSEDGQYKLVEREPLEAVIEKEPLIKYIEKEPLEVKYIEREPLKMKLEEPIVKYLEAAPLRLSYVPISSAIPLAYRKLVLRSFQPFTYHYEQISHKN